MSVIYGTVLDKQINVDVKYGPQSPKAGQTYQGFRLTYKMDSGEVRSIEKPMQQLFKPALKKAFDELAVADEFTLVQEKVGNFLNIVSLSKGKIEVSIPDTPSTNYGAAQGATAYRAGNSLRDYETAEERKTKQKLIVRQATLNAAIQYSADIKLVKKEDILTLAKEFENYVYEGIE